MLGTLLWLSAVLAMATGGGILLIPMPHLSHVNLFATPGEALVAAGHEVSILVPRALAARLAGSKLQVLGYEDGAYIEMSKTIEELAPGLVSGEVSFLTIMKDVLIKKGAEINKDVLEDTDLMEQIDKKKFDLVIVDGFPGTRAMFVIPYRLGVPYMVLSALSDPWMAGVPASRGLEPVSLLGYDNNMNFLQRFLNTLFCIAVQYKGRVEYLIGKDTYVREYAPSKPPVPVDVIYQNADFWLINHDVYCLDYPKVSAPNFQYIGSASAKASKPLPAQLEEFVQGAEHGLIVLSFGSSDGYKRIISTIQDRLMNAFQRLKQRVIISGNLEQFKNIPANVKILDWLPQNDLLGHRKTVLFIAHGGNNGQLEAIYHGVPSLALPLTAEQTYNALRVVNRGYGLMLDVKTFTADDLYNAISQLTSNPAYKQAAVKCSSILSEMPSASDQVVFWANHVMKHGSSHLQMSRDQPLFRVLNLDVFLAIGLILYFILKILLFILRLLHRLISCVCCCCCRKSKAIKQKRA